MSRSAIAFFITLLFLVFVPPPSFARKVRPPIELSFSYRYLSESETRIVLITLANVEANKVSIRLELPLGLRLLEGKVNWEGSMKRGERKKIEIIVQDGGGGTTYEILGRAKIHPIKGGIFKQKRQMILDRSGENTLHHRPPIQNKGPRGNILEFRE